SECCFRPANPRNRYLSHKETVLPVLWRLIEQCEGCATEDAITFLDGCKSWLRQVRDADFLCRQGDRQGYDQQHAVHDGPHGILSSLSITLHDQELKNIPFVVDGRRLSE